MEHAWSEHQSCARCGSALGDDFRANHLGVRFCVTCYTEAVETHAKERGNAPWLRELCNRCNGSLINGYETNYLGVLFCSDCFQRTHTSDGRPRQDWEERGALSVAQRGRDREDGDGADWSLDEEEEEGVYLHDVFFVTTVLALVMYALVRFGGVLMSLGGS